MKKIYIIILSIILILCSTACASPNNYAGIYEIPYSSISHNLVIPHKGSGFYVGTSLIDGTRSLKLNSDGTGTFTFTINKDFDPTAEYGFESVAKANGLDKYDVLNYLSEIDYILCSGDVAWEVVDGVIYITGTANYQDNSGETYKIAWEYELKGKSLMNLDGTESGYTKIS